MGVRDGFRRVSCGLLRMYSLSLRPIAELLPRCRLLLAAALAAGISTLQTSASADSRRLERINRSVVKIYVTKQRPAFETPWLALPPVGGTGSGFVIRGNRILTNAHVASDARFMEVQHDGDPRRYRARVKFTGHDCDLAVLEVDDPEFFDGPPLEMASQLPPLNAEVAVIGYPTGGERLSLTRGVVSRIDYSGYAHSEADQHLVLQVDAAINPGNSGGPIIYRGKVAGLAFQGMAWADNIGYGIPVPVLDHFIKDIEDGVYNGYPELGVSHLDTRSVPLRRSLGLPDTGGGCVVTYVDPFGSANDLLRNGDVLLSIQGRDIASDGSVLLDGRTVAFSELIERMQWGDTAGFKVWRDGRAIQVAVRQTNRPDPFAFRNQYDVWPDYHVFAGMVFSPLSRDYLKTLGKLPSSPNEQQLIYAARYVKMDDLWRNRSEFVVLTRRLPHPVNTYFDQFLNGIVESANGRPVPSLAAMRAALAAPTNGFHVIRFASMDLPMILDPAAVADADREIRSKYALPAGAPGAVE